MKKTGQLNNSNQVAEIQLIYKSKVKASERPQIRSSRDAQDILRQHWEADHIELFEEFKVLYLNTASRVLGIYPVFKGGISSTICDPRLVLAAGLKIGAHAIILAHNHPSASLIPSDADKALTHKIKKGANYMDMKLFDHIILTSEGYFSFSDQGLI